MEPREKAAQLPDSPGVYIFKDAGGTVIYVGKATSLRSRARSYFLESRWTDAKTGSLAREIAEKPILALRELKRCFYESVRNEQTAAVQKELRMQADVFADSEVIERIQSLYSG